MRSTFAEAAHPRGTAGRFVQKLNDAPATMLSAAPAAEEWPDEDEATYAEWMSRNEAWAEDAPAEEPSTRAGSREAWTTPGQPF